MQRLVEVESVSFQEETNEQSLRPSSWHDYIGQEKIDKNLTVFMERSKRTCDGDAHRVCDWYPALAQKDLS